MAAGRHPIGLHAQDIVSPILYIPVHLQYGIAPNSMIYTSRENTVVPLRNMNSLIYCTIKPIPRHQNIIESNIGNLS